MPTVEIRGHRLAYQVSGDGPPMLLVMGFGMPGLAWQPQVDALARELTVCTYDNRGVGGSTLGRPPLGLGALAADAAALLDHLGWGSAHVAGVSMGGMVAQHLALEHRERVRSLALIATSAGGLRDLMPTPEGRRRFVEANKSRGEARRAALAALLFPDGRVPGEVPVDFEALLEPAPAGTRLRQLAAILRHDTRRALPSLGDLPTLVIRPDGDILVRPACSDVLAARIPGARLVSIPDAGHGVTFQEASRVSDLLREHVARVERGRPGAPAQERQLCSTRM